MYTTKVKRLPAMLILQQVSIEGFSRPVSANGKTGIARYYPANFPMTSKLITPDYQNRLRWA